MSTHAERLTCHAEHERCVRSW